MAASWYSLDTPDETDRLVAAWSGAPVENAELCGMLLEVAKEQVLAFAPELTVGDPLPVRWVYAQLMQAENLYNAGRAQSDGDAGTEGYSFIPRPLDKTVRSIIRPTSGAADVF